MDDHNAMPTGPDCPEGQVWRYSNTDGHHGYFACVPDKLPEACTEGQKWTSQGQTYVCVEQNEWMPQPQMQSMDWGVFFIAFFTAFIVSQLIWFLRR